MNVENKYKFNENKDDIILLSILYIDGKQFIRYIDENEKEQLIETNNTSLYKDSIKKLSKDSTLKKETIKEILSNINNNNFETKKQKSISKEINIIDFINNNKINSNSNQIVDNINSKNIEKEKINEHVIYNENTTNIKYTKQDYLKLLRKYTNNDTLEKDQLFYLKSDLLTKIKEENNTFLTPSSNKAFTNKYMLIYLLLITTCVITLVLAIIFKG